VPDAQATPITPRRIPRVLSWIRRARRFEVTPAQVNPPMAPTWWRRPFVASTRFWMRRGKRFEPGWGQANATPNPPFGNDLWKRAFQAGNRIFQRRARRYDVPIPAQVNPPFVVEGWRKRIQVRSWLRRNRQVTPVEPLQGVTFMTPRRSRFSFPTRRGRSVGPVEGVAFMTQGQRRRVGFLRRSRSKADPPLSQAAAAVAPPFIPTWRRRLSWQPGGFLRRLRTYLPPFLGGLAVAANVGAVDSAVYTVGALDSSVYTAGAIDTLAATVGATDVADTTGAVDLPVSTTGAQDTIP